MPRRPRNYLLNFTYHVYQRGVNKCETFFGTGDYAQYLELWKHYSAEYGLVVHAYCLMTNHVHFLVTPTEQDAISRTTRSVGSNYASYINAKYRRTGTLWEGRHRSSLIDSDQYLVKCLAYIDLNPVVAGLVAAPGHYLWSSYREVELGDTSFLSTHPRMNSEKEEEYRRLIEEGLSSSEVKKISQSYLKNLPTADREFVDKVEKRFGVSLLPKRQGRRRSIEKNLPPSLFRKAPPSPI